MAARLARTARSIHNGAGKSALLSQEGSTIETAVEIVRGVVPEPHSLSKHSEIFRLRNHPSRHRKERDNAALLTQEGIFANSVSVVESEYACPSIQTSRIQFSVSVVECA
jgi:hypothetical protein